MKQFSSALSLRKTGLSPDFLQSDRAPGVYREFFERYWVPNGQEGFEPSLLHVVSRNVDDPNPTHGFYETGRRFELFDAVPALFLKDLGLGYLAGILEIEDHDTGTVYRFRQV